MTYEYEQYLAHHGIKGQKWGVRRFQNEDGSLTSEGRDRYGIEELVRNSGNDVKAQRHAALVQRFKNAGLSDEQSEKEAIRREKIDRALKIAAGVAVTAAVAYGGYKAAKYISKYSDKTIKQGSIIQRITANPNEDSNFAAYMAVNNRDKVKYKGMYGKQIRGDMLWGKYQDAHQVNYDVSKKLKIAGERNGRKVFDDLMKNDKTFANDVNTVQENLKKMGWDAKGTNYERFNVALVDHSTDEAKRVSEKFYNALKKKGYNGVLDVNDRSFSGYNSKKPVILFDQKTGLANKRSQIISDEESDKAFEAARKMMIGDAYRKKIVDAVATDTKRLSIGAGFLASLRAVQARSQDRVLDRKAIERYKKEHPNTTMSDKEILKSLRG